MNIPNTNFGKQSSYAYNETKRNEIQKTSQDVYMYRNIGFINIHKCLGTGGKESTKRK